MPLGHRPTPPTNPVFSSFPLILVVTLAFVWVSLLADPGEAAASRAPSRPPVTRALFSKPGEAGVRHLVTRDIRRTPGDATIHVVVWTFTSRRMAGELVRASHRGVRVRVVVGGIDCDDPAVRRLRRGLARGSGVTCARHSARGGREFAGRETNLHQKTWTFSETGGAHWVSVVTSANATTIADQQQYNDAYQSVGDRRLFRKLSTVFRQQARDRPMRRPYRHFLLGGGESVTFSPWNSPRQEDPVVARIRAFPAHGLVVRATYSNWQDARGVRVARALARKQRHGAHIRVIKSEPFSPVVGRVLRRAGVRLQSAYFGPRRYSHLKFMTAEYRRDGREQTRVWTGSENMWSASQGLDEVVLEIPDPRAYAAYTGFFDDVWDDHR